MNSIMVIEPLALHGKAANREESVSGVLGTVMEEVLGIDAMNGQQQE